MTNTTQASPTWKMKNGETIEIRLMENSHLINAIRMVRRLAKSGVNYSINLGYDSDKDYPEYDYGTLYGVDVYRHYDNYYQLIREAKKRKIYNQV